MLICVIFIGSFITKSDGKGGGGGRGGGGGGRGGGGRGSRGSSRGGKSGNHGYTFKGGGWFGGSKTFSHFRGLAKTHTVQSRQKFYQRYSGHSYAGRRNDIEQTTYFPFASRYVPQPAFQMKKFIAAGVTGALFYGQMGNFARSYYRQKSARLKYHKKKSKNATEYQRIKIIPFYITSYNFYPDQVERYPFVSANVDNEILLAKQYFQNDSQWEKIEKAADIDGYLIKKLRPKCTEIMTIPTNQILLDYQKLYDIYGVPEVNKFFNDIAKTCPQCFEGDLMSYPPDYVLQLKPPGPQVLPLFIDQVSDLYPHLFNKSPNQHINPKCSYILLCCAIFLMLFY